MDYGQDRFLFSMNEGDYANPQTYNVDGGREEFRRLQVVAPADLFAQAQSAVGFEPIGKGRQGAVLVKPERDGSVPIVRTTTKYNSPAQIFPPAVKDLADQIQHQATVPVSFNNVLAEVYNEEYARMGFHSDQAQDLLDGSCIALFSCYADPKKPFNRKLVVEPKEDNPNGEKFEIPLTHNSVIVFSLDTNRRFRHKIVLDHRQPADNEWMGLTFRTSKTLVRYEGDQTLLADGTPLKLLGPDPDRTVYRMRGKENKEVDFHYPALDVTLSESDLVPPITTSIVPH